MAQTVETWFSSLGPITRFLLAYVILTSAGIAFGRLNPAYLAIYYPTSWSYMQLWRPFTSALFFGPFSFPWIMTVMLFTTYCNNNEVRDFANKPAEFAHMLVFIALILGFVGSFIGIPWTGHSFILALCWVHCKRNPTDRVIFFGFDCRLAYFPWILTAFQFIVSQTLLPNFLGIVVGHLYFFLKDILPYTHGCHLLNTPPWMASLLFRIGLGNRINFSKPFPRRNWGHGHMLGSQQE